MTGAGLEEEGALEAGVAAMSSILGMQGLPREQAAVANLMTGIVKAMGSIACLSEVLYGGVHDGRRLPRQAFISGT